jgi:hypothetical protein
VRHQGKLVDLTVEPRDLLIRGLALKRLTNIGREPWSLLFFIGKARVIAFETGPFVEMVGNVEPSVGISAIFVVDEGDFLLLFAVNNVGREKIVVTEDDR